MALPYYYPSAVPHGPGVATMSSERVNQIYQQHNIQTMAYLRNTEYLPPLPPPNYNFAPIPYKPYYPAPVNSFLNPPTCYPENLPFSHTVPNMIYPITPMPLRPVPYANTTLSFQNELRQVVKRVAESDDLVEAESKRHKAAECEYRPLIENEVDEPASLNNTPLESIVISDDEELKVDVETVKPLSGPIMNPLYVENDISSSVLDPNYDKQLLQKPGPGQQYITKIRNIVEGNASSSKNLTKEKKVRQKSPKSIKENNSKKKKITVQKLVKKDIEPQVIPSSTSQANPDSNAAAADDYFVLGPNGTLISRSFYASLSWQTYKIGTSNLVNYFFTPFALATQTIDGHNPLDKKIIDDIVSHVVNKCSVGRDSVRSKIAWICADEALRRRQEQQLPDLS